MIRKHFDTDNRALFAVDGRFRKPFENGLVDALNKSLLLLLGPQIEAM